jgi:diguanylate cyclase (GGDEF)-like protein
MGYPEMMRDIMEQVRREEFRRKRKDIENHPIIDNLTGLYNDRYLHLRLDEEMARAKRYSKQLSFIMLELGCVKKSDAKIENPDEEEILKMTSDVINSCIRYDIDLAFRYREDKFAIILPEVNVHHADNIAQSIQKQIWEKRMENITMHAGIVQCDYHDHAEELIRSASDALLKDKKESKKYMPQEACPMPGSGAKSA